MKILLPATHQKEQTLSSRRNHQLSIDNPSNRIDQEVLETLVAKFVEFSNECSKKNAGDGIKLNVGLLDIQKWMLENKIHQC